MQQIDIEQLIQIEDARTWLTTQQSLPVKTKTQRHQLALLNWEIDQLIVTHFLNAQKENNEIKD